MSGGDENITEEKRSDAETSSISDKDSDDSGSSSDEDVKAIKLGRPKEDGCFADSSCSAVELMVKTRARRPNAGNKMLALLQSTYQEDDFYKSAYGGGFNEDDEDDVFESPVHSDVDEVDSDFDRPEEDDEPISDDENEWKEGRRKAKGYKEPSRRSRTEVHTKNNAYMVTGMLGRMVAPNSVDAETQAARLKEAEETEKANVESLRKYEQFELERKKKRDQAKARRRVPPPFISVKDTINETTVVVPDIKVFKRPDVRPRHVCAITGRPARYRDPITGLPYSTPFAFKIIRDKYEKFLMTTVTDTPEVKKYLDLFEWEDEEEDVQEEVDVVSP